MDWLGATYTFDRPESFWLELQDFLDLDGSASLEAIDYALRSFLVFAAHFYDDHLQQEGDLQRFLSVLLQSRMLQDHPARVLDRVIDIVLTEEDAALLYLCLVILETRAKQQQHILRLLKQPRLPSVPSSSQSPPQATSVMLVLIGVVEKYGKDAIGTHPDKEAKLAARERLGLAAAKMLYEICRVSKLSQQDLSLFPKSFVEHLFLLVESTRDGDEILNYTLIKLIIALNEQFMVLSLSPADAAKSATRKEGSPEANVVLQTIREYLGAHKTFGENLIFILNRCDGSSEDLCVSLLILKILYLLFTTPCTQEYFYTNDLCVLVDVFLRELTDLPEENEGLRHTYLRVLHPLLTNTQLKTRPYQRQQIRRVLHGLISDPHRRHVNSTTKRLVERNLKAQWCVELDQTNPLPSQPAPPSPTPSKPRNVYHLQSDEVTRRGSTLSVDSVAEASHAPRVVDRPPRKHQLSTNMDDPVLLQVSSSSPSRDTPRPASAISFSGRRKPPEPPQKKKGPVANVSAASTSELPVRKRALSEHAPSRRKISPPDVASLPRREGPEARLSKSVLDLKV